MLDDYEDYDEDSRYNHAIFETVLAAGRPRDQSARRPDVPAIIEEPEEVYGNEISYRQGRCEPSRILYPMWNGYKRAPWMRLSQHNLACNSTQEVQALINAHPLAATIYICHTLLREVEEGKKPATTARAMSERAKRTAGLSRKTWEALAGIPTPQDYTLEPPEISHDVALLMAKAGEYTIRAVQENTCKGLITSLWQDFDRHHDVYQVVKEHPSAERHHLEIIRNIATYENETWCQPSIARNEEYHFHERFGGPWLTASEAMVHELSNGRRWTRKDNSKHREIQDAWEHLNQSQGEMRRRIG